jgi:hypothetical protein
MIDFMAPIQDTEQSEHCRKEVVMILLAISTSLSMLTFISLALVTLGAALLLVQWKMN